MKILWPADVCFVAIQTDGLDVLTKVASSNHVDARTDLEAVSCVFASFVNVEMCLQPQRKIYRHSQCN